MRLLVRLVTLAVAIGLSIPACADTMPIKSEPDKPWKHAETGIELPANAGGFRRDEGFDFGKTNSDVAFQYRDQATGTLATVYYFRAGLPDVSIWAERVADTIVEREDTYGRFDQAGRRWVLYTPTSGGTDSGIRFVYPVSGKEFSATGAAFEQHGDWLLGVRISSQKLDPAGLEARLAQLVSDLAVPAGKHLPFPAYAIQPCTEMLVIKPAKPVKAGSTNNSIGAALVNSILPETAKDGEPRKVTYCRDQPPGRQMGVYRPNAARDSYVIAIGDGGIAISANRDAGAELMGEKPRFGVTLITNDEQIGFALFQSLPSPAQAIEAVSSGRAIYGRTRMAGDSTIRIAPPGK